MKQKEIQDNSKMSYFDVCKPNNINSVNPWSRAILEKITLPELVNKFPAFYASIKFISVFARARHLYLSLARPIQCTPPSYILNIYFNG